MIGLEKGLSPSPTNLWHYLNVSMFDPILPFRVADLRPLGGDQTAAKGRPKDRVIVGTRNRLMNLVAGKRDEDESGSEILHYRPMEFVKPHGATIASIGIEYWVVANYQKKAKSDAVVLRARSSDLYAQPRFPIVGTLNGQNQGELPARIIAEIDLEMVSHHIVVHIDASRADSRVRRELFSTSREGFKDGPVLTSIIDVLRDMLKEDEDLKAVEQQLTEKLITKQNQETKSEVRKEVQRLLKDAGLELTTDGTTEVPGAGPEQRTRRKRKKGGYKKREPLPTLPYPQVTKFKIVYPTETVEIPLDDYQTVLVETDADAQFDKENRVAVRSEPAILDVIGKAPLRGGRIRWRMKCNTTATVGATGKIIVALTKPDGVQMTDEVAFLLAKPATEKSKRTKSKVPPFDIVGINPTDDAAQWATTWVDLDEDNEAAQTQVSYRVIVGAGKLVVYYSEIYGPFKDQVDSFKEKQRDLCDLFIRNYEVWIGYHAILQHQAESRAKADGLDDVQLEELNASERDRVARMQVNQARRMAELQKKLLKGGAADK